VNADAFPNLLEHAQAAFNRAAIDDPHLSIVKLIEKMLLSRADPRQARHLDNAAAV
jgi:hypothetical protein